MYNSGMQTRSKTHGFDRYFRKIIVALMEQHGRDFTQCELCPAKIPEGKFDIHHTKYEGATFWDLRIVCKKCNHAPQNVGLQ